MSMRDFEIFNYAPFKDMELIAIDEAASSKKADDFIWRPDSGIQTFSGDDTLLGLKDMAKLSQIGSDKEAMSLQIAELRAIKEGTPSSTQPIAFPWLSPQVVTLKKSPKKLPT